VSTGSRYGGIVPVGFRTYAEKRANGNGFGPSQKLATVAVKRMIPKDKLHVGRPQLRD